MTNQKMIDEAAQIGALFVRVFIPGAESLKAKRSVLKRLKDRMRAKFNVSIAELGGHDKWQVATLGIVMVGVDHRYLESTLQHVLSFVDAYHAIEVTEQSIEYF